MRRRKSDVTAARLHCFCVIITRITTNHCHSVVRQEDNIEEEILTHHHCPIDDKLQ